MGPLDNKEALLSTSSFWVKTSLLLSCWSFFLFLFLSFFLSFFLFLFANDLNELTDFTKRGRKQHKNNKNATSSFPFCFFVSFPLPSSLSPSLLSPFPHPLFLSSQTPSIFPFVPPLPKMSTQENPPPNPLRNPLLNLFLNLLPNLLRNPLPNLLLNLLKKPPSLLLALL